MAAYPEWLHILAWIYLSISFACGLWVIADEIRYPQKMFIMNIVWPITCLYFGPIALWAYYTSGRKGTRERHREMQQQVMAEIHAASLSELRGVAQQKSEPPSREQVAVAASHCGAGCTLGDIVGEWVIYATGLGIAGGEIGTRLLFDFLLAWAFGVVFQYFTIVPMRGLPFGKGVLQAMRADTLSIVAFQLGMSVWAALTYFVIFPAPHLHVNESVFWFMMQIGMIIGFFTSYPANILLAKTGWKERMPQYNRHMKKKMAQQELQKKQAA